MNHHMAPTYISYQYIYVFWTHTFLDLLMHIFPPFTHLSALLTDRTPEIMYMNGWVSYIWKCLPVRSVFLLFSVILRNKFDFWLISLAWNISDAFYELTSPKLLTMNGLQINFSRQWIRQHVGECRLVYFRILLVLCKNRIRWLRPGEFQDLGKVRCLRNETMKFEHFRQGDQWLNITQIKSNKQGWLIYKHFVMSILWQKPVLFMNWNMITPESLPSQRW